MWLDEHRSKSLLTQVGISTPLGVRVTHREEATRAAEKIGLPVYIKALAPQKDRAAAGGILRATRSAEVAPAFDRVTRSLECDSVRVEAECTGQHLWFVSLGIFAEDGGLSTIVNTRGGTGVEQRAGKALAIVPVDVRTGLRQFHVRRVARSADIDEKLVPLLGDVLSRCYELLLTWDASLVELNPLVVSSIGEATALDARLILDDFSLFRHPEFAELETEGRDNPADLPADLRTRGIDFVRLGAGIGIVGLGAGLTMHLADAVRMGGGSPAFFFDATRSAVKDWPALFDKVYPQSFADDLEYGLDRVIQDVTAVIVNFTSGGTPVDGMAKALIEVTERRGWSDRIVAHMGGNSARAAAQLVEASSIRLAATLEEAVRLAVAHGDIGNLPAVGDVP